MSRDSFWDPFRFTLGEHRNPRTVRERGTAARHCGDRQQQRGLAASPGGTMVPLLHEYCIGDCGDRIADIRFQGFSGCGHSAQLLRCFLRISCITVAGCSSSASRSNHQRAGANFPCDFCSVDAPTPSALGSSPHLFDLRWSVGHEFLRCRKKLPASALVATFLDAGTSRKNDIGLCRHQFGFCRHGVSQLYAMERNSSNLSGLHPDDFFPGERSLKLDYQP